MKAEVGAPLRTPQESRQCAHRKQTNHWIHLP
jgi:hypothetical protein